MNEGNKIGDDIVEAANILKSGIDEFGHEYLASHKVGQFLDAFPSIAESFESIAQSLERIANKLDKDAEDGS